MPLELEEVLLVRDLLLSRGPRTELESPSFRTKLESPSILSPATAWTGRSSPPRTGRFFALATTTFLVLARDVAQSRHEVGRCAGKRTGGAETRPKVAPRPAPAVRGGSSADAALATGGSSRCGGGDGVGDAGILLHSGVLGCSTRGTADPARGTDDRGGSRGRNDAGCTMRRRGCP